jgi:hypothetical protein
MARIVTTHYRYAVKSLSIAGIGLTAFAVVIPLVASWFGFRWLNTLGLLLIGGICLGAAHWLAPKDT